MLILGIDPGTALAGYGLVDYRQGQLKVIDYGVVKTPPKMELPIRLLRIHEGVAELIHKYQPDAMAVEELFFNQNAKTFFSVSQARGAVILTGAQCGLEVFEYTPLQVKQAVVGYGRAEKKQVQEMVKRILAMDHIVKPDDAADALAVAICHANSYRLGGLAR